MAGIHQNLEHASTVTYMGTAGALATKGLHLSDICMLISVTASVVGVSLQIWVATAKVRLMKRSERWKQGEK